MTHHQYHHQKKDYSLYGWVFLILAIVLTVGVSVYYFSSNVSKPEINKGQIISSGNGNTANWPPVNDKTNENANEVLENGNINAAANENINAANLNIAPDFAKSNIMVRYPQDGATVGLPLKIQGEGREFESTIRYRVKTASGSILADGATIAGAPDMGQFGQYLVSPPLNLIKTTPVLIEVFANSPKDGAEIDKVTHNATIDPALRALEIYFGNSQSDPKSECDKTIPAIRSIVKVEKIGTASLRELLKGPTDEEKTLGFLTSIPSDAKLQTFTIDGMEGRPDFTAELDKGVAGSCRVSAIRAQIEKTLLQFSTVQTVRISVEGRTKDILQP